MLISGGEYSCECSENGGFAFVSDGGILNVTDGTFANNVAARRGAAVSFVDERERLPPNQPIFKEVRGS